MRGRAGLVLLLASALIGCSGTPTLHSGTYALSDVGRLSDACGLEAALPETISVEVDGEAITLKTVPNEGTKVSGNIDGEVFNASGDGARTWPDPYPPGSPPYCTEHFTKTYSGEITADDTFSATFIYEVTSFEPSECSPLDFHPMTLCKSGFAFTGKRVE